MASKTIRDLRRLQSNTSNRRQCDVRLERRGGGAGAASSGRLFAHRPERAHRARAAVKALDRVVDAIAPGDAHFQYRLVPKATLERRKASNRLSPDEGPRLARLARVWSEALDVWGGEDEARDFLFRPHPMAEDKRPVDLVIQSEFGAELMIDILGGLRYGTAA